MCLHEEKGHPESPERIRAIYNEIVKSGFLSLCRVVPIRLASDNEILSVHSEKHLANMKKIISSDKIGLRKMERMYNSVYLNNDSYYCALLSAGGVIELCEQVVNGSLKNGIAIVRPPGHHAECSKAMGFCLFNNVAIAAKQMIDRFGLKRVVILDWDVHHGNATQHMFESDPMVLFISIHRYDNATFYPGSGDASPQMTGKGNGVGRNVNIAWNVPNGETYTIGDHEYIFVFDTLVVPMINEFNPELIIVSAGFDCAYGDPLGGLHVTQIGFNQMTKRLMNYANGKVVIALEGGYNVKIISECMLACLTALLKQNNTKLVWKEKGMISNIAIHAVNQTISYHKPYWQFLKNCDTYIETH